jgi:hydrogenase maturation protease
MLDGGYDTTILIDATPRGEEPGTVYLIELELETIDTREPVSLDAHGMNPNMVLEVLKSLGATRGRVYVVGCEPLETEEGIGLSTPVARGVEDAIKLVHSVVERLRQGNFIEVKGCKQVSR